MTTNNTQTVKCRAKTTGRSAHALRLMALMIAALSMSCAAPQLEESWHLELVDGVVVLADGESFKTVAPVRLDVTDPRLPLIWWTGYDLVAWRELLRWAYPRVYEANQ